jgi:hypothetical protein
MVNIDIPVSASVQDALNIPACSTLALPMPKPLKVTLPSGAEMKALVDMSKGIPNDCSMSFNLMLQMAPVLAAMECPMKILKLLKPMVDIVKNLPTPPVSAVQEFADAAIDLAPCFAMIAQIPVFVKDLLALVRAILNCLLGQIRTVRDLMKGLSLRMGEAEGNPDLLATLQCAQDNAQASMQALTQGIDPIAGVLTLVSTVASIAGMSLDISLSTPSADPSDLAAIDALIDTLQGVVDVLDQIVGGDGG